MAYLTVNSKFTPYTFDELLKPFAIYDTAYKEQEAAMGKLENDAAVLSSALSQTNDPIAYKTYSDYIARIQAAADDLAANGLSQSTRHTIRRLGTEYNSSIVPIQVAYNRRKALQDEQRKALLSNDSLIFQRNLNTVGPDSSLDKFIEDPNYDYGNVVSGNNITARTSQMAGHLAKELSSFGQGKPIDKYTNTFLQTHGFSKDQVLRAVQDPTAPDAEPVLKAIVESAIDATGIASWKDPVALKTAYDYATMGLWSAIGQTNVSTFDNYGAKLAAQQAARARTGSPSGFSTSINGVPINPLNIYSQKERTQIGRNIKDYSKYFQQVDGKWTLTKEGLAEYNKTYEDPYLVHTVTTSDGKTKISSQSQFKTFIDELTSEYKNDMGTAWGKYLEDNQQDRYDATRSTEYDYVYDPTQQDSMKQVVMTAARGTNLEAVDYDAASKTFKPTGETLSLDKFTSPDYQVVASRMSSGGTQIMVQNKKTGVTTRYRMPSGINISAEASRDNMFRAADQYRELFASAETPQEQALAYQKYSEAIQSAYLYQSQIGLTTKTKPQEYNPYIW